MQPSTPIRAEQLPGERRERDRFRQSRHKLNQLTYRKSATQALIIQEARQIRRAFREWGLSAEDADKFIRQRSDARTDREDIWWLDLGRARAAAFMRAGGRELIAAAMKERKRSLYRTPEEIARIVESLESSAVSRKADSQA
jgi:hypothetical protein